MTPAVLVVKLAAGVIDTGGIFAPVQLKPAANLPLVSLILVVHLDCEFSKKF
jgi:hypothetical protein